MKLFENKKAVIVGGSGGIGSAIARSLAAECKEIVIHGGHESEKFDSLLKETGARKIVLDLEKTPFCQIEKSELVAEVRCADILCVCYGPFLQKNLHEMSFSEWQKISLMNYALPGALASLSLESMSEKKWGRILFFGGTGTSVRNEYMTNVAYAGAKTALNTLVNSIATTYAKFGITCNALLPGFTKTEYTENEDILSKKMPLGTIINKESLSKSALFLLENSDLNGVLMRVDRGWSPLCNNLI